MKETKTIRDRVTELRRIRAGDLVPHPHNWRTHSQHQQRVLKGVLQEVGYADALLARELADGSLQLIDGHLRAETTPETVVPVLMVDLDDREAEKVLLTHDPLAGLASSNADELAGLLERVETDSEAVREMLAKVAKAADVATAESLATLPDIEIPESYQVMVECCDEAEQQTVYERLRSEGHRCRVLTL